MCCFNHLLCFYTDHYDELWHFPVSTSDEILSDVWDGAYLKLTQHGRYFSSGDNLALALSTDGVPVFQSSSTSLWPVYLTILNLPPGTRMNAENVLMAGLWYGKKPSMDISARLRPGSM